MGGRTRSSHRIISFKICNYTKSREVKKQDSRTTIIVGRRFFLQTLRFSTGLFSFPVLEGGRTSSRLLVVRLSFSYRQLYLTRPSSHGSLTSVTYECVNMTRGWNWFLVISGFIMLYFTDLVPSVTTSLSCIHTSKHLRFLLLAPDKEW